MAKTDDARSLREVNRELQEQLTRLKEELLERAQPTGEEWHERYRAIFEQAAVGVGRVADDGRWLEVNRKLCEIVGYSEAELLELTSQDITHPDDVNRDLEFVRKVLAGEVQNFSMEKRYIRKDRSLVWVNLTVSLERDAAGAPRYLIVIVEDISGRKAAEERLQNRERLLEKIFDLLPVGLWIVDRDGRLLKGNPAGVEIWGAEPHVDPEEYGVFKARRLPSREEMGAEDWALARTITEGVTIVDELIEIDTFDGQKKIILNYTAPVLDDRGEIEGAIVVNQDVTDRTRAESSLRESEHQWRSYVENAPYGVFVWDASGRYLKVNPQACRTTGYSEEELLGMEIPDLLPPESRPAAADHFARLARTGEAVGDFLFETKAGEQRWWAVAAVKLSEDRFLGFTDDITERRRLQAQLIQAQKMESIGRLAGGIAHDFNNMLSVIIGTAELAQARIPKNRPVWFDLKTILDAAHRSARISRQLLAFARKQDIVPEVMDLSATITETLKVLGRLIGEDIELAWEPRSDLWPVLMDPAQFDQILANLAVNARDAISGVGRITIAVQNTALREILRTEQVDLPAGEYVQLTVSDTGSGMGPEALRNAFDPFFTTKEEGQGTGLGLATVYGIVKQNDGFVTARSEGGEGARIDIYLPRRDSGPRGTTHEAETEVAGGDGEVILLVEADDSILEISRSLLEGLGYRVLTASTPVEALTLARTSGAEIDLLLTDVVLPEMNGRELAERLVADIPALKCLFMSGYAADTLVEEVEVDRSINFIPRPATRQVLAAKVQDALRGSGD